MKDQNALIIKLNKKLDQSIDERNFEQADEISRQLCRLQGLEPAGEMPGNFILRLKKESGRGGGFSCKRISKKAAGIVAAAAVFLLLGGTVGAAVLYNSGVSIFKYGLSTSGEALEATAEDEGSISSYRNADLTDVPDTTTLLSKEESASGSAWVEKKVYDETYTVYDSEDAVSWTPTEQKNHVTEYRYEDYYAAAMDAGFDRLMSENYRGEVLYYIYEHTDENSKDSPDTLSITGNFSYGSGSFSLNQYPGNEESTAFAVITNETGNNREYVSSCGYQFALTDDQDETGKTRTHTLVKCDNYFLTLKFTGMSEEEIHAVLETVRLNDNF